MSFLDAYYLHLCVEINYLSYLATMTKDKDNTVQEPQISFDGVDAVCCIKFRDI